MHYVYVCMHCYVYVYMYVFACVYVHVCAHNAMKNPLPFPETHTHQHAHAHCIEWQCKDMAGHWVHKAKNIFPVPRQRPPGCHPLTTATPAPTPRIATRSGINVPPTSQLTWWTCQNPPNWLQLVLHCDACTMQIEIKCEWHLNEMEAY